MKIEDPCVPQDLVQPNKYFLFQKGQRKGNNTKYTDEIPLI